MPEDEYARAKLEEHAKRLDRNDTLFDRLFAALDSMNSWRAHTVCTSSLAPPWSAGWRFALSRSFSRGRWRMDDIIIPLLLLAALVIVALNDPARKKMKRDCNALKNSITMRKTPGVSTRRSGGG